MAPLREAEMRKKCINQKHFPLQVPELFNKRYFFSHAIFPQRTKKIYET
jgi:hypothetical protein